MRRAATLAALATAARGCGTAADCSFAGACVAAACVCERGFMGATCATLDNTTRVPLSNGFRLPDFHVWGSQVAYDGSDGLYHMAASVYPRALPFLHSWLYTASIVTASSRTPLGPYALDDAAALPQGAPGAWDRNVMNPKLLRAPGGGPWLLFYTGNAYEGATPSAGGAPLPANQSAAQASQRCGLATAASPRGPFTRRGAPVISPRAEPAWDSRIISNVAVTPLGAYAGDTRLLAIYKASSPAGAGTVQTRVCFGAAIAAAYDAPFVRVSDEPILPCPDDTFYAEDPTVWVDATTRALHLVFKDFKGTFSPGEGYCGAHAVSSDGGRTWALTRPALAYTTTHVWADGVARKQHAQERAQVLLNETDGAPIAMFYATDTDTDGSERYYNLAIPARPEALL
jgi:hypothetical protein